MKALRLSNITVVLASGQGDFRGVKSKLPRMLKVLRKSFMRNHTLNFLLIFFIYGASISALFQCYYDIVIKIIILVHCDDNLNSIVVLLTGSK